MKCPQVEILELKDKVAELKALAKEVGKERGIHRYYKPMDVAIDAMLDTIKEVNDD